MKILFLTRRAWPEIGGVERHVHEVSRKLEAKGHKITIISERNIKPPKIKYIGLLSIWFWFLKNRKLIENADVIHCHDVFIWYLPFRYLYPRKRLVSTIHGLEWDNPLNPISRWQKKLAVKLSDNSVGIGKFLEKYTGVKFDLISYGAASMIRIIDTRKNNKAIVYVGRLEENTGLTKFFEWLDKNTKYKVDFIGEGRLKNRCKKYGKVHGATNPAPFYKKAKYVVPGGYLAALEGLSANCELKLFWNDKIKKDYWQMSPFIKKDVKVWAKKQTWEKLANEYLDLYNNNK